MITYVIILFLTNGIASEIVTDVEVLGEVDVDWTSLIIEIIIGGGLAAIGKMVWDIREKLTGVLIATAELKEVDNRHDSEIEDLQNTVKEHTKDINQIKGKLKLH